VSRKLISASALLCMAVPCLAQNAMRAHIPGPAVRQTVAPGKMSAVSVNSLPNAVCTLRAQDDSGAVRTLKLYADDQGEVRFHARPSAETDSPPNLQLSCAANDQVMDHGIELRASTAGAASAGRIRQAGRARPALTGDPMLPSQEELLSRGYPLRPDPEKMPEAYATWLRMVTSEATEIEPRFVTRPGFRAPPPGVGPVRLPTASNSNNWSGFVLYRDPYILKVLNATPPQPYVFASSEWYVPSVTGEQGVQDNSVLWVGMDGESTGDVLQDGTGHDAIGTSFLGIKWTMASIYAWTEFFPADLQQLTNFRVGPGDHMLGQVWMGNAGSKPTLTGVFGVCFLFNLTTGSYTYVYITPPAGTTFTGSSAEWIMERPAIDGVLPDLSDYGVATMFNAWAQRADGTVVHPSGNPCSLQVTMTNDAGATLSSVARLSDSAMFFIGSGSGELPIHLHRQFHGYRPTSRCNHALAWLE
jgi:hypothetical protein